MGSYSSREIMAISAGRLVKDGDVLSPAQECHCLQPRWPNASMHRGRWFFSKQAE